MFTTMFVAEQPKPLDVWFKLMISSLSEESRQVVNSIYYSAKYHARLQQLQALLSQHENQDDLTSLSLRLICLGMASEVLEGISLSEVEKKFDQMISSMEHNLNSAIASFAVAEKIEKQIHDQMEIIESNMVYPMGYQITSFKNILKACATNPEESFYLYLQKNKSYKMNVAQCELLKMILEHMDRTFKDDLVNEDTVYEEAKKFVGIWLASSESLAKKYKLKVSKFRDLLSYLEKPHFWGQLQIENNRFTEMREDSVKKIKLFGDICQSLLIFVEVNEKKLISQESFNEEKNAEIIDQALTPWVQEKIQSLDEESKRLIGWFVVFYRDNILPLFQLEKQRQVIKELLNDLNQNKFDPLMLTRTTYINHALTRAFKNLGDANLKKFSPLGNALKVLRSTYFSKKVSRLDDLLNAYGSKGKMEQLLEVCKYEATTTERPYLWDLWMGYSPRLISRFYYELMSNNHILHLDTQTTTVIAKKNIDYVVRGAELAPLLQEMNWQQLSSPIAIINQTLRGHASCVFLELSPENEWRAILTDTGGHPSQIEDILHQLELQPEIKSILVYTRYFSYNEMEHNNYERSLQASPRECAAAAIHISTLMKKRSRQGVNVFDELLAEWNTCKPNMHKVCGEKGYDGKAYFKQRNRVVCVPVCAAPIYIIKISQSKVILADWAALHGVAQQNALVGNRKNETLATYRERRNDVMKHKQLFYPTRWWKALEQLLLTGQGCDEFNVFANLRKISVAPVAANLELQQYANKLHEMVNSNFNPEKSSVTIITGKEVAERCASTNKDLFSDHEGELVLLKGRYVYENVEVCDFELLLDPYAVNKEQLGFLHFSSSPIAERIFGNKKIANLLINGYDKDDGYLISGKCVGFIYQRSKDIFDCVLPIQQFSYARHDKEVARPYFEISRHYKSKAIRYYDYNEANDAWGPDNELINFSLRDLLRLGFGLYISEKLSPLTVSIQPTLKY